MLYIGLAVVLSLALGLFWLLVVVGIHGILEFLRHILQDAKPSHAILETLWELKLDIGIIIFAFWLAVYFDVIFGMAGLTSAGRAAAQTGSRLAQTSTRVVLWQRIIRGALITIDDFAIAFKQLGKSKRAKQAENGNVSQPVTPSTQATKRDDSTSWAVSYSTGDKLSIGFGLIFLVLILIAPLITGFTFLEVLLLIGAELRPLP